MADQAGKGIAWTERTWNPVRGCSRVSEGCRNCYAETVAARFSGPGLAYEGLARQAPDGARWTGVVRLVQEHLEDPIRWQKPRRIFVNSMSDLFHEKLNNHDIARVFQVMAKAPRHSYQVLTKRAARMPGFFGSASAGIHFFGEIPNRKVSQWQERGQLSANYEIIPSNIWMGVSTEDQRSYDDRLPDLLKVPARTRWLSVEPQLGPIDLGLNRFASDVANHGSTRSGKVGDFISWVVIGGESGPRARAFDLVWARSLIAQCREHGVAVFMKQMGAVALDSGNPLGPDYGGPGLSSGKAADPKGWPADLRLREYPGELSPGRRCNV